MRTPSAAAAMGADARISRWTADTTRFATVSLGAGTVRSAVRVTGDAVDDDERELRARFAALASAPIEADATLGIGIIGSPTLTRSIARGLLVQLVHAYPPGTIAIAAVPGEGWEWARALPQWDPTTGGTAQRVVSIVCPADTSERSSSLARAVQSRAAQTRAEPAPNASAVIVVAESLEELTIPCRVILSIDGPMHAQLISAPDDEAGGSVIPELVSEAQAFEYATVLGRHAAASGFGLTQSAVPAAVGFGELQQLPASDASTSLRAIIGITGNGPLAIDLVSDGPHAVVAGTTGSGKSELLTTWVAALAATYQPEAVGFLLVDFKGGSAFAPLAPLPHCLGVITDLAQGEAERALRSLKAELRRRERMLSEWGVRSVAEAGGRLGRLVIVVDEFAAMLDNFPELHALFVDIAARGRSLGVHTILCTQRPAGVVRDALLANCAVRVSLRVHDAMDSIAVVGTDAASTLSAARPGRCIVAVDGERTTAQIAWATRDDIETILRATGTGSGTGHAAQRRPWLDPLPADVALESLPPGVGGVIVGVEDVPDEQRQGVVNIRPADGHLLVMGVHGSGKSTALLTIAAQCASSVRIIRHPETLWDTLERAIDGPAGAADDLTGGPCRILLIDDLDALIARMPDEYQDAAVERLAQVLREGSSRGLTVVAAMQRMTPLLRACCSLFASTLLLEQKDKHEFVLAGGVPELYDDRHRPGSGLWRGHRIQVARASGQTCVGDPSSADGAPAVPAFELPAGPVIVVSRTPAARARALRESSVAATVVELGDAGHSATDAANALEVSALGMTTGREGQTTTVLVADPATWQGAWPLYSSLARAGTIVFDGCAVADVRGLLHSRTLPPLTAGPDRVVVRDQDGRMRRARFNWGVIPPARQQ